MGNLYEKYLAVVHGVLQKFGSNGKMFSNSVNSNLIATASIIITTVLSVEFSRNLAQNGKMFSYSVNSNFIATASIIIATL